MLVVAEKFSSYLCGPAACRRVAEHICGFIKIAGGAHLAPGAVLAMGTFAEIEVPQCTQRLQLLALPYLSKALFLGVTQHNAVAAIAGVVNALGIEVHTALAYVAHLGFGSTALGGDWCFVE